MTLSYKIIVRSFGCPETKNSPTSTTTTTTTTLTLLDLTAIAAGKNRATENGNIDFVFPCFSGRSLSPAVHVCLFFPVLLMSIIFVVKCKWHSEWANHICLWIQQAVTFDKCIHIMHSNCCADLQVTLMGAEPGHANFTRLYRPGRKNLTGGGKNLSFSICTSTIEFVAWHGFSTCMFRAIRAISSLPRYKKSIHLPCTH